MLESLAAIAKLLLYAGSLTSAGLALAAASLRPHLGEVRAGASSLARCGATIALLATIGWMAVLFLRLGGDPSAPVLSAMFISPTGWWAGLLAAGCAVLLATGLTGPASLSLLGASAMIAAYGVNGHAPSLGVAQGAVALAHVAAASWWLGALVLLLLAARRLAPPALATLTRRFGAVALFVIAVLAAAGALLVALLVDFSHQPWLSSYGQLLALKIALVLGALFVAALNRLRLTPRIVSGDPSAVRLLQRNIVIEISLIVLVLIAMAILTTWTSPHA